jgi:transposase
VGDAERLWAVEDSRQSTGWLERQLSSGGEQLVRVPPKLTVRERRAGRMRDKSDPIDALARSPGPFFDRVSNPGDSASS